MKCIYIYIYMYSKYIFVYMYLTEVINHFQVRIARQTVQFELESLHTRPEQEPILMDMIHYVSSK